jgi:coatomer subunit beta
MKATNMSCLTPEGAILGECDFLSANMYALGASFCLFSFVTKTVFLTGTKTYFLGEDALANLSVKRTEAGTITGHVRIRSKTQCIALSLGDRITMGV